MVADLRKKSALFFDAHLMTVEPESLVDAFMDAGADAVTFHVEACVHAHSLVQRIQSRGKKAGVSIVPSTPVAAIEELMRYVDLVLVMTVNPGFGGQKLIARCVEKVAEIAAFRKREGLSFDIAVDGGVNDATAAEVIEAGADILVMGSAFFESEDPEALLSRVAAIPRRDSSREPHPPTI